MESEDTLVQLEQQQNLIDQLKALVRERDDALQKKEKELQESNKNLSKARLQAKAKAVKKSKQQEEKAPDGATAKEPNEEESTTANQEDSSANKARTLVMKRKLEDRNRIISEKDEVIKVREEQLQAKQQILAEKDVLLQDLTEQLEEKTKAMETMHHLGGASDDQSKIQEMIAQMVYKDKKVMDLNTKILEQDKRIMDLQEFAGEKDEVIRGRDKVVEILQTSIKEKDQSNQDQGLLIAKLTARVESSNERLDEVEEALRQKEHELKTETERFHIKLTESQKYFEEMLNEMEQESQRLKSMIVAKDDELQVREKDLRDIIIKHEHDIEIILKKENIDLQDPIVKMLEEQLKTTKEVLEGKVKAIETIQNNLFDKDKELKDSQEGMKLIREKLQVTSEQMMLLQANFVDKESQWSEEKIRLERKLKDIVEKHEVEVSEKDLQLETLQSRLTQYEAACVQTAPMQEQKQMSGEKVDNDSLTLMEKKVKELEDQLSTTASDLKLKTQDFVKVQEDKHVLEQKLAASLNASGDLGQDMEKMNALKEEMEKEVERFKSEVDDLQSKLSDSVKRISDLQTEMEEERVKFQNENERFTEELSEKSNSLQDALEQLDCFSKEIVSLKLSLKESNSRCEKQAEEVENLKSELGDMEKGSSETQKENEDKIQNLHLQVSELENQILSLQNETSENEDFFEQVKNELRKKEEELEDLVNTSERLKSELSESTNKINSLQETIELEKKTNSDLSDTVSSHEENILRLEISMKEKDDNLKLLEQEKTGSMEAVYIKLKEVQEELKNSKLSENELESTLDCRNSELEKSIEKCGEFETHVASISKDLEESRCKVLEFKELNETLKMKVDEYQLKLSSMSESLEADSVQTQQIVEALKEEKETQECMVESLQRQLITLEAEVKAMRDISSNKDVQISILENNMIEGEQRSDDFHSVLTNLQRQQASADLQIAEMTSLISSHQSYKDVMEEKIKDMENKLSNLEAELEQTAAELKLKTDEMSQLSTERMCDSQVSADVLKPEETDLQVEVQEAPIMIENVQSLAREAGIVDEPVEDMKKIEPESEYFNLELESLKSTLLGVEEQLKKERAMCQELEKTVKKKEKIIQGLHLKMKRGAKQVKQSVGEGDVSIDESPRRKKEAPVLDSSTLAKYEDDEFMQLSLVESLDISSLTEEEVLFRRLLGQYQNAVIEKDAFKDLLAEKDSEIMRLQTKFYDAELFYKESLQKHGQKLEQLEGKEVIEDPRISELMLKLEEVNEINRNYANNVLDLENALGNMHKTAMDYYQNLCERDNLLQENVSMVQQLQSENDVIRHNNTKILEQVKSVTDEKIYLENEVKKFEYEVEMLKSKALEESVTRKQEVAVGEDNVDTVLISANENWQVQIEKVKNEMQEEIESRDTKISVMEGIMKEMYGTQDENSSRIGKLSGELEILKSREESLLTKISDLQKSMKKKDARIAALSKKKESRKEQSSDSKPLASSSQNEIVDESFTKEQTGDLLETSVISVSEDVKDEKLNEELSRLKKLIKRKDAQLLSAKRKLEQGSIQAAPSLSSIADKERDTTSELYDSRSTLFTKDTSDLNDSLSLRQSERDLFEANIRELEVKYDDLQDDNLNLRHELEYAQDEVHFLARDKRALENCILDIKDMVANPMVDQLVGEDWLYLAAESVRLMVEEKVAAERKLLDFETMFDENEKSKHSLISELENSKEMIDKLNIEIDPVKEAWKETYDQLNNALSERNAFEEQLTLLKSQVEGMFSQDKKEEFEQLLTDSSVHVKRLQAENEDLKRREQSLMEQIENLTSLKEEAAVNIEKYLNHIQQLQEENGRISEKLVTSSDELAHLQFGEQKYEEQISELIEKLKNVEEFYVNENQTVVSKLSETEASFEQMRETNHEMIGDLDDKQNKIQALETQLMSLQIMANSSNEEINNQLQGFSNERGELEMKINDLRTMLKGKESKLSSLSSQYDELSVVHEMLQNKLEMEKEQSSQMIKSLEEEIEKLRFENADHYQKSKDLHEGLYAFNEIVKRYVPVQDQMHGELYNINECSKLILERFSNFEADLEVKLTVINQLKKEIASLSENLKLANEAENTSIILQNDLTANKELLYNLEQQLNNERLSAQQQIEWYKVELANVKREKDEIMTLSEQKTESLNNLEHYMQQINEENSNLKKVYAELQNHVQKSENDATDNKAKVDAFVTASEENEKVKVSLETELSNLRQQLAESSEIYKSHQSLLTDEQNKNKQFISEMNDLQHALQTKDSEISSLSSDIENLKHEVSSISNVLNSKNTYIAQISHQNEEVQKQVAFMHSENTQLQNNIVQLQSERDTLLEKVKGTESDLNKAMNKLEVRQSENNANLLTKPQTTIEEWNQYFDNDSEPFLTSANVKEAQIQPEVFQTAQTAQLFAAAPNYTTPEIFESANMQSFQPDLSPQQVKNLSQHEQSDRTRGDEVERLTKALEKSKIEVQNHALSLSNLTEILKETEAKLKNAEQEKDAALKKATELDQSISDILHQQQQIQNQFDEASSENATLKDRASVMEENNADLEERLAMVGQYVIEKDKEIISLSEMLEAKRKEVQSFSELMEELKVSMSEKDKNADVFSSELSNAQKLNAEQYDQIKTLTDDLQNMSSLKETLQNELHSYSSQVSDQSIAFNEERSYLFSQIDSLTSTLNNLEKDKEELSVLKQKLKYLEEEKVSMLDQISALQVEAGNSSMVENETIELKSHLDTLKSQLENMQREKEKDHLKCVDWEKEVALLSAKLSDSEEYYSISQQKLVIMSKENEALSLELKTVNENVNTSQQNVQSLDNATELENLKQSLIAKEEELSAKELMAKKAIATAKKLKFQLNQANASLDQMKNEAEELKKMRSELEMKISSLEIASAEQTSGSTMAQIDNEKVEIVEEKLIEECVPVKEQMVQRVVPVEEQMIETSHNSSLNMSISPSDVDISLEIESLQSQLSTYKECCEELQKQVQSQAESVFELESKLKQKHNEIDELEGLKESLKSTILEFEASYKNLQESHEKLQTDSILAQEQLEKKCEILEEQSAQWKTFFNSLQQEQGAKDEKLEKLMSEIALLKQDRDDTSALKSSLETKDKKVLELLTQLETVNSTLRQAESDNNNISNELKASVELTSSLKSNLESAQALLFESESSKSELNTVIEKKDEKLLEQSTHLQVLEQRIEELMSSIEAKKSDDTPELESLQSQVQNQETFINSLEVDLESTQTKLLSTESTVSSLNVMIEEKDNYLQELIENTGNLEKKIGELTASLETAKTNYDRAIADYREDSERLVRDLNTEIKELTQQAEETRSNLNLIIKEKEKNLQEQEANTSNLDKKILELTESLEIAETNFGREIDDLQSQVENQEVLIRDLNTVIKDLTQQVEETKSKHQAAVDEQKKGNSIEAEQAKKPTEDDFEKLKSVLEQTFIEKQELENEKEKLQLDIDTQLEETRKMQEMISSKLKQVENVQDAYEKLQSVVSALTHEKEELLSAMESSRGELEGMQQIITQLQFQEAEARDNASRLFEENRNLMSKLEHAQDELSSLKAMNENQAVEWTGMVKESPVVEQMVPAFSSALSAAPPSDAPSEDISALKLKLEEKEEQLRDVQNQLDKTRGGEIKREKMLIKLKSLKDKNDKLQTQVDELQQAQALKSGGSPQKDEALREERRHLEEQVSLLHSKLKEVETHNGKLFHENSVIKAQLKDIEASNPNNSIESVTQALKMKEDECMKLKSQTESQLIELDLLKTELSQSKSIFDEKENSDKEKLKLKEDLSVLENDLNALRKELEFEKNRNHEEKYQLNEEKNNAMSEIWNVTSQLELLQNELKTMDNRRDGEKKRADAALNEVRKLEVCLENERKSSEIELDLKVSSLQSQLNTLTEQYDSLSADNVNFQDLVASLSKTNSNLKNEVDTLSLKLKNVTSNVNKSDALDSEMNEVQQRLKEVEEERGNLFEEFEELREEVVVLRRDKASLLQQCSDLSNSVEKLNSQLDHMKSRLIDKEKESQAQPIGNNDNVESLKGELSSVMEENKALKNEINGLMWKLEESSAFGEEVEELQSKLSSASLENKILNHDLEEARGELTALQTDKRLLMEEVDRLGELLKELESNKNTQSDKLDLESIQLNDEKYEKLSKEKHAMEDIVDQQREQIDLLELKLSDLEKDFQVKENQVLQMDRFEKSFSDLQESHSILKIENKTLKKKLDNFNLKIDTVRSLETDFESLNSDFNKVLNEKNEMANQIEHLNARIQDLLSKEQAFTFQQQEQATREIEVYQRTVNELEVSNDNVVVDHAGLQEELQKVIEEKKAIAVELKHALHSLKQSQSRCQQTATQVSQLSEDRSYLNTQLSSISKALREKEQEWLAIRQQYGALHQEYVASQHKIAELERRIAMDSMQKDIEEEENAAEADQVHTFTKDANPSDDQSAQQDNIQRLQAELIREKEAKEKLEKQLSEAHDQIRHLASSAGKQEMHIQMEDEDNVRIRETATMLNRQGMGYLSRVNSWLRTKNRQLNRAMRLRPGLRTLIWTYFIVLHLVIAACVGGYL